MALLPNVLSSLQVGTHVLKNRIGMSALTRNRAQDTYPTELMKEYYVQRAVGGAGLIVTEGILITRQGTAWLNAPGIWDKKHIAGWKNIVDAVHEAGGTIFAQLWHAGRLSHPDSPQQVLAGVPVYGPSPIAARGGKFRYLPDAPGYDTPTEIEDPWKIIAVYKQAALNAKEAGFDGVELHGAGGYLVAQFLDNTANQRTDKWGGTVENRARFGLEVLKVFVEVFGPNVGCKLAPVAGNNDVGMPLEETLQTFSHFIAEADKLKLAYIVLLRYDPKNKLEVDGASRVIIHDVMESYKPLVKNARFFVNGGMSAEEGETLVSEGKIDGIFIGFYWVAHPDLVRRIERGVALDTFPDFLTMEMNKSEEDWATGYTDYPVAVY